jgi:hypothetical protein
MKKRFLIPLVIIVGILVLCGISALLATPSWWLYQHNYYFQSLVNALHGYH